MQLASLLLSKGGCAHFIQKFGRGRHLQFLFLEEEKKEIPYTYRLLVFPLIPGGPKKNGTVDFLELCSDQQLSFFTLLDRTSFPHYNNTKIIKFG